MYIDIAYPPTHTVTVPRGSKLWFALSSFSTSHPFHTTTKLERNVLEFALASLGETHMKRMFVWDRAIEKLIEKD